MSEMKVALVGEGCINDKDLAYLLKTLELLKKD